MLVGVPAEVKTEEHRVAITPVGVKELVSRGHSVLVQRGAGLGSSIRDDDYESVGASLAPTAQDVFASAELLLKVKEPQPFEIELIGPHHLLFTYLHLAAYPESAAALLATGCTAVAYETVQLASGSLPLLAPMSEIAGRMATQQGAHYLERPHGGRGVLLGGAPGVAPAKVTVVGAGSAGTNAAMIAAGMGAEVTVLDIDVERLRRVEELRFARTKTVRSSVFAVDELVPESDLVVGAVLVAGARAPTVVTKEHVAAMKDGSVVVDIAIDQGGCIETSRETSHAQPTYVVDDVVHYAVGNIPGAVPNTSTYALTNATLPYVLALADGLDSALVRHPELIPGINMARGRYTNGAVAGSLGAEAADPLATLGLAP